MGLLSQGKPLNWDETKKYFKYVQERGIAQFINIYNKSKDRADGPFKWGDEVEYILIKFGHQTKTARVSLKAEKIFKKIADRHAIHPENSSWHPEFGAYMVEGTPAVPYGTDGQIFDGLCDVEENMKFRRNEVQQTLEKDETVISLTNFPRLGCANFTHPTYKPQPNKSASGSLFFPDEAVFSGHPRFKTIMENVRSRRNSKVKINVPIYKDVNTPKSFLEQLQDEESQNSSIKDHIYMDAMGFGMGCCCLQITMQGTHLAETRMLYDQLAPICPIAMALSAASPIYRGYMADIDCRWNVISCSVDDRTKEESGETELKECEFKIAKSRYDSISSYISKKGQEYNDIPLEYNHSYYNSMIERGVEPEIARHIAHLFIRNPLAIYKEKLDQSDDDLDHFENIQSTNWQTMRFKPPPSINSKIGWRVEFRPLEAQITDFENSAYTAFVILLSRVILAYKLNFLMPISLVDANMQEGQKRDSVGQSKFWFRCDILPKSSHKSPLGTVFENSCATSKFCVKKVSSNNNQQIPETNEATSKASTNNVRLMTADEIINGSEDFVGIMPIINHYIDSLNDGTNIESFKRVKKYMKLISDRAALKTMTTAKWMREFVMNHPKYKHDSIVTEEINYDLLKELDKIGKGYVYHEELQGKFTHDIEYSRKQDVAVPSCTTSDSKIGQCSSTPTPVMSDSKSCAFSKGVGRIVQCCLHPSSKKLALNKTAINKMNNNPTAPESRSISR